jgi:hypothetical protein
MFEAVEGGLERRGGGGGGDFGGWIGRHGDEIDLAWALERVRKRGCFGAVRYVRST